MAMIFGGLVFFVGVIMKYLSLEVWAARNIEMLIIGEDSSMTLLIHGTLLEIRSAGQTINVAVNMIFSLPFLKSSSAILCHMKFGLFFFFAGFVIIMISFIHFFSPETKNVPIEEMNKVWKLHWLWGKYIPDEAVIGAN
ncbi:hypothetical protein CRYUN_Cryun04dG0091900 [Craigia yunnanensis]